MAKLKLEQPMMSVSRSDDNTWSTSDEKKEPLTEAQDQMANELDDYTDETYGVRGTQQIPKGNPDKYFMGGLTLAKAKADERLQDQAVESAGHGTEFFNTVLGQSNNYKPFKDKVEDVVENNPEQVLSSDAPEPIKNEAAQVLDNNPNNDEANDKAIEEGLEQYESNPDNFMKGLNWYNTLEDLDKAGEGYGYGINDYDVYSGEDELGPYYYALRKAVEEGDSKVVEEIVQEHPEETKPLVEDTPLETEIEQMTDGDKRTDEVNNEAVEQSIPELEDKLDETNNEMGMEQDETLVDGSENNIQSNEETQGFNPDKFLNEQPDGTIVPQAEETPNVPSKDEQKIESLKSEQEISNLKFRSNDMKFAKEALMYLDKVNPELANNIKESEAFKDPVFWDRIAQEYYKSPDKVKHSDKNSLKNKIDSFKTGRAHKDYQPRYTDVEKAFQDGGKEGMYEHVLNKAYNDFKSIKPNNLGMLGGIPQIADEIDPTVVDNTEASISPEELQELEMANMEVNESIVEEIAPDAPEEIKQDLIQEAPLLSELNGEYYYDKLISEYEQKAKAAHEEIINFKLAYKGSKEDMLKSRELKRLQEQEDKMNKWVESLRNEQEQANKLNNQGYTGEDMTTPEWTSEMGSNPLPESEWPEMYDGTMSPEEHDRIKDIMMGQPTRSVEEIEQEVEELPEGEDKERKRRVIEWWKSRGEAVGTNPQGTSGGLPSASVNTSSSASNGMTNVGTPGPMAGIPSGIGASSASVPTSRVPEPSSHSTSRIAGSGTIKDSIKNPVTPSTVKGSNQSSGFTTNVGGNLESGATKTRSSLARPKKAELPSGEVQTQDYSGSMALTGGKNTQDLRGALVERLKLAIDKLDKGRRAELGFSSVHYDYQGTPLDKLDGATLNALLEQVEQELGE